MQPSASGLCLELLREHFYMEVVLSHQKITTVNWTFLPQDSSSLSGHTAVRTTLYPRQSFIKSFLSLSPLPPHPITGSHGTLPPTLLPRLTLSLFLYLSAHHLPPGFCSRSFHLSPCLETLPLHILLQHNKALKTQRLKATTTIYWLTILQRGRVLWQWLVSALCVTAAAT